MSDPLMPLPTRQGLVARIQAILLKPAETWDLIAVEPATIQSIFVGYVVPLAAIGPVCRALEATVFGVGIPGIISWHEPIMWALIEAVVMYVLALVLFYIEAFIINMLASSFDGRQDMLAAVKVAAYSGTAAWLAGIFCLLPFLGMLGILGLYSLYLLYLGLPKLMKSPPEKSVIYIVVIVILMIVAAIIPAGVAGGIEGAARMSSGVVGMMSTPGGTITVQDKTGSATINVNQMAAAASQMAAQASAVQAGTAGTAGPVKVADAQALLDLTPAIFNGSTRADTATSSGGVAGMAASTAEATYTIGGGSIHLKVADIGSMAGVGAFANAMNVNASSSSAGGYDTTTTQGNRITHERYSTTAKSGEYDVMVNGRVSVDATGNNVDMATLKSLVAQVDLDKADALTK